MEAWMAFVSIIAIVAIIVVAGGLIAFIGHMVIGVFDKDGKQASAGEFVDYSNYKKMENSATESKLAQADEYNFEEINKAKAEQEKQMLAQDKDVDMFKLEALEQTEDEDLEALESRLKAENEKFAEQFAAAQVAAEQPAEPAQEEFSMEEDFEDIDSLLDEIANDVIEEEKENMEEPVAVQMDESLQNYSIDDYLNASEPEVVEQPVEETEEIVEEIYEEIEEEDIQEDIQQIENDIKLIENVKLIAYEEDEEDEDEGEEIVPDLVENNKILTEKEKEIEDLKAQLEELNKKLEEAKTAPSKVEVVSIDMTEEECVKRLEVLEERLKVARKEYKINLKEFKPLKKVMNDLEKYQTKLRRKETIVAKKKVALYGVNNYVDIDKEKAEKLANELELLDGLRLSVQHCEEVISANKDRYPILEHTNKILEDQISNLEADIASTTATLDKIRNGEGNKQ